MRNFLLACALCLSLFACKPRYTDTPQVFDLDDLVTAISRTTPDNSLEVQEYKVYNTLKTEYPDVDTSLIWRPCLEENAWYDPTSHVITMCTEIEDIGPGTLMVVAHEFAHAIEDQRWDIYSEMDADEIAVLEMFQHGQHDPVVAQIRWFNDMQQHQIPGEPHPSSYYRAWFLACMELGYYQEYPACTNLYNGIKMKWEKRFKI